MSKHMHQILAHIFSGQVPTEGVELPGIEPVKDGDVVIGDISGEPLMKALYIEMETRMSAYNKVAGIINGKGPRHRRNPLDENEVELDRLSKELGALNATICFCLASLFPDAAGKATVVKVGWKLVEKKPLCRMCGREDCRSAHAINELLDSLEDQGFFLLR